MSSPAVLHPDMTCSVTFDSTDLDDLINCFSPYFLTVRDENGNIIISDSNAVTVNLIPYVGEVISLQIESVSSNDQCVSYYEVIDDERPELTCPFDTVSCLGFPDSVVMPALTDDCSATLSEPVDVSMNLDCLTGFAKRILRSYTAIDGSGNTDTCVQEIMIE